jgi:uncharacterized protein YqeY
MSLVEKINESIKDAMRAKEKERLEALRSVKAALLLEATKGGSDGITEQAEIQILNRLYKQRKEAAGIFTAQARPELAEVEEFQAGVIESFLPARLSDAEIQAIITEIVSRTGASGMKDMGKVMGEANSKLSGKADPKFVADTVKKLLGA